MGAGVGEGRVDSRCDALVAQPDWVHVGAGVDYVVVGSAGDAMVDEQGNRLNKQKPPPASSHIR